MLLFVIDVKGEQRRIGPKRRHDVDSGVAEKRSRTTTDKVTGQVAAHSSGNLIAKLSKERWRIGSRKAGELVLFATHKQFDCWAG